MSFGGSLAVYELLKDKVVWHYPEREKKYPDKVVIVEGPSFKGLAYFSYQGWKEAEHSSYKISVTRWATIPEEISIAYHKGFFDSSYDKRMFQSKEEFEQFSKLAIEVNSIPDSSEYVGTYFEDSPYQTYNASIYYKDNQYYICNDCNYWTMD